MDSLTGAKRAFADIVQRLDPNQVDSFLFWVQKHYISHSALDEPQDPAFDTLTKIAEEIKAQIPVSGVFPSEALVPFPSGVNRESEPSETVNVDAFLYDEDQVDQLVDEGKLSRNFCKDCLSHNTSPLNFVSHSASKQVVKLIFTCLLKKKDVGNKTVLDIGSRFGPVLYGAYLYSKAKRIIGVEMNEELCSLQRSVVEKFNFKDKIEIICADLLAVPQVVSSANLIVLHNVFEFFQDKEAQIKCWQFLKEKVKRGTVLVTIPSLPELIDPLETETVDISSWVRKRGLNLSGHLLEKLVDDEEDVPDICVYDVL